MTELSPLGTMSILLPKHETYSDNEKMLIKLKQGHPVYGVDMKIVDDDGNVLPTDGKTSGNVLVRGPW